MGEKLARLHPVPALHHRPLALPLAQRDPVLDGLRLARREIDGLAQRILGRRVGMVEFQHPPQLVQRHHLVAQCRTIEGGKPIDEGEPRAHRRPGLTEILQRATEIDIGGVELRIYPQRVAQGVDGGKGITAALGHHRHVEVGSRELRVIRIERDPALVERCGRRRSFGFLKAFGVTKQRGDGG